MESKKPPCNVAKFRSIHYTNSLYYWQVVEVRFIYRKSSDGNIMKTIIAIDVLLQVVNQWLKRNWVMSKIACNFSWTGLFVPTYLCLRYPWKHFSTPRRVVVWGGFLKTACACRSFYNKDIQMHLHSSEFCYAHLDVSPI